MAAEPGTRLAERYRLQERISELRGSTLWKAVDEPLARPVAVRTFQDEFSDVGRVIAAARAAGRVGDSRLAQVFDADESAPCPYLVCEWLGGERLADLLAHGPLELDRAVGFIREAADALATAHAAGVGHHRLDPSSLVWAKGGTVKITGLAIDAALRGPNLPSGSPVTDARALGSLLYAAVTGYWPGDTEVGLPPAPRSSDGLPLAAGDLRPEVPSALDDVIARARGQRRDGTSALLDSPSAVRDALAGVPRTAPAEPPTRGSAAVESGEAVTRPRGTPGPASDGDGLSHHDASPQSSPPTVMPAPDQDQRDDRGGDKPRPVRTLLIGAVGALVLAATALGAWGVTRTLDPVVGAGPAEQSAPTRQPEPTAPGSDSTSSVRTLTVDGIEDYDPFADQVANPDEVGKAIDGDPQTTWSTQTYTSADFGNLKPGLGLMLDMGRPVSVATVRVRFGGPEGQGASLELYAGGRPEKSAMTRVASVSGASGRVTLDPKRSVEARYLLVWLTKLPNSGGYQAEIAEIAVRGSS